MKPYINTSKKTAWIASLTVAAALSLGVLVVLRGQPPVLAAPPAQEAVTVTSYQAFEAPAQGSEEHLLNCVLAGMPAVEKDEAVVQQIAVVGYSDAPRIALSADLGQLGEYTISNDANGFTVEGTDPARAALMQFEMTACVTGEHDEAQYGLLLDAVN